MQRLCDQADYAIAKASLTVWARLFLSGCLAFLPSVWEGGACQAEKVVVCIRESLMVEEVEGEIATGTSSITSANAIS